MRQFILFYFTFIVSNFLTHLGGWGSEVLQESFIELNVHNVGQGNCVTAHFFETTTKTHTFLLMDAGSSSYKKELKYQGYFKKRSVTQKEIPKEIPSETDEELLTSPSPHTATTVPASLRQEVSLSTRRFAQGIKPSKTKDIKKEEKKIGEIRLALGATKRRPSLQVKTVFISHPDKDHYNWLPKIFLSAQDKIENIILGGLPESYSSKLRDWLSKRLKSTRIYFPAIFCHQPIKALEDILLTTEGGKMNVQTRRYGPRMFSDPKKGWPQEKWNHLEKFNECLPFGQLKTYLLAVNPTHYQEPGNEVFRGSIQDDTNNDSLVIKLKIGSFSADIMGDATSLTTHRILTDYKDSLNFLQNATVTIAAHHGSYTHGSSHPTWIEATSPHYGIFSCGTLHNHPALETYENLKQSKNLAYIKPPHKIWVWEKADKKTASSGEKLKSRKAIVHTTYRGLFSTFNSGTVTIRMPLNGKIKLESQVEKTFTSLSKKERKKVKEDKDNHPIKVIEVTSEELAAIDKATSEILPRIAFSRTETQVDITPRHSTKTTSSLGKRKKEKEINSPPEEPEPALKKKKLETKTSSKGYRTTQKKKRQIKKE